MVIMSAEDTRGDLHTIFPFLLHRYFQSCSYKLTAGIRLYSLKGSVVRCDKDFMHMRRVAFRPELKLVFETINFLLNRFECKF